MVRPGYAGLGWGSGGVTNVSHIYGWGRQRGVNLGLARQMQAAVRMEGIGEEMGGNLVLGGEDVKDPPSSRCDLKTRSIVVKWRQ